jgi:hypothetical protein
MHDGSWEAFGSALLLVPECSLGLFVSFSSTAAANGFDATVQPFLDRFAPRVDPAAVSGPATGAPAPGFYAPTRHNESTMERLLMLLGPMRLTVDGDGTVHFKGKAWHDAGGGLYRAQDGDDHLVARGRYVGTDGPTYERMSLTDGLFFNLAVLGAFLLISLTIPVYLALRLFRRSPSSPAWRAARWLTGAAAALGVTFLVLLVLTLAGNVSDFIYDAPARFRLLMLVPLLALAAGVLGIAGTVRGWSSARRGARIHQVASLAGLAALTWFLWNWNLIGWQF